MRIEFQRANPTALELHLVGEDGGRRVWSVDMGEFTALVEAEVPERASEMAALGKRIFGLLNGAEEWLGELGANETIEIDCSRAEDQQAHVAWELMHDRSGFLVQRGILPVRLLGKKQAKAGEAANRPLRVLFMACSPRDVKPVLDFELEERIILDATERHPIHLIPEESGNVRELGELVGDYGAGYFDAFHLTGHGDHYRESMKGYLEAGQKLALGTPVFLTENDAGKCRLVTAGEIAEAFGTRLPRVVFLSGCRTGEMPKSGEKAATSLARGLLDLGVPAVLGWARPVYDISATLAAGVFYGALGEGQPIEDALRNVFRELTKPVEGRPFAAPDWHLLRLFAPGRLDMGLVTAPRHPKREPYVKLRIEEDFLDPATKTERVAGAMRFVGRRRVLQRCLPAMEATSDHTGLAIWGMGGLGKSSVAARLCDRVQRRRPEFRRVVLQGVLSEGRLAAAMEAKYRSDAEALGALRDTGLDWQGRFERFFEATEGRAPLLLVLDDFEQNAALDAGGAAAFRLTRESFALLEAVLRAIRERGSASRVIVTCRYFDEAVFPDAGLLAEQLPQMNDSELRKKGDRELGKDAGRERREELTEAALGNPRLFEKLAGAPSRPAAEVQGEARVELGLGAQWEALTLAERTAVARLGVYHLPAGPALVEAVAPGADFRRAVGLGAVEVSEDAGGSAVDLRVTALFRPLVDGWLGAEESRELHGRAARAAKAAWVDAGGGAEEERAVEVVRLARWGGEREIACGLARGLMGAWLGASRYREMVRLGRIVTEAFEDAMVLARLGEAERWVGDTRAAREHLERSLELGTAGAGPSATALVAMAKWRAQHGEVAEALSLYERGLAAAIAAGNAQGEGVILDEMAGLLAQQGDVAEAMDLYRQSLALKERIGDVREQAVTLHNMAVLRAQQGDVAGALDLYRQSLAMNERIGNVQGQAATLHQMAGLQMQQGDVAGALDLYRQSLAMNERIGNVQGQAVTLHDMAVSRAQQGDVAGAMDLYR